MGRKRRGLKRERRAASSVKGLTIDRKNRSGHFQGSNYSAVYRDGKSYTHTAWDDNAEETGVEMPFTDWVAFFQK